MPKRTPPRASRAARDLAEHDHDFESPDREARVLAEYRLLHEEEGHAATPRTGCPFCVEPPKRSRRAIEDRIAGIDAEFQLIVENAVRHDGEAHPLYCVGGEAVEGALRRLRAEREKLVTVLVETWPLLPDPLLVTRDVAEGILVAQLADFAKRSGLALASADEMLCEAFGDGRPEERTQEQLANVAWLTDFLKRWQALFSPRFPVTCMTCRATYATTTVEGSTGLCDACLAARA